MEKNHLKGKLTDDQMDILEGWINKGPKTFTRLFAITRDGCDATSFHQKCDNQGPTVTVLYNQQGSVYGGYASASWQSKNEWVTTADSFLFQLRFSGRSKANKFKVHQNSQRCSLYGGASFGPVFGRDKENIFAMIILKIGKGNDLCTFTNSVNNAGGCFPLNGNMDGFGKSYNNQGITTDQVNNGTMCVTELEVYKVSDGQRQKTTADMLRPWRKTKTWNAQFLDELKEEIVSFKPREDFKVSEVRILMIGPVGAGKSSFYNTINSVFCGHITQRAHSGSAQQSLTTAYTPYTLKYESGASLNFRLCDSRGLEETTGISEAELVFILDGKIPDYYQFGSTPLSTTTPGFKSDPSPNDKIHCAVFVLDSSTIEDLSDQLVGKMKSLQNLLKQRGIPQLIILTKIDRLSADVENNVSSAFRCQTVAEHVEKASQLLGLARLNVLPVKNYENEVELDISISIMALIALRQILNFAKDFLANRADQQENLEPELKRKRWSIF